MHYGEIKEFDIADGDGVRVSLFVSGCRIHCKDCFNQCTWDFDYGKEFMKEIEDKVLDLIGRDFISGLTVLGGEPFEPENQAALAPFLSRVRARYPQKTIWCYTGYNYDRDILPADGRKRCPSTDEMLRNIDVLVDGPFVAELKDISLKFRGSSNQRIIKLR